MAKNTTKKTKSDVIEEPAIMTEDEVVVEDTNKKDSKKTTTPTQKTVKKYAPTDTIECRSVVGGKLILIGSKSHLKYTWEDYGDTAWVEYQDLQALQSRKSIFLTKPRFIIKDDDLVDQWGAMLKPVYDKMTDKTIEEFFEMPLNKFKAQLRIVPDGLKSAIKTKAVQMIKSEELYDIRKVREIDEAWGTDFVAMFMK
jgi:hypothetical protein